ncbi:uncharacterized protein NECHADRAFT_81085 [Fusarium vanettenii 77-13-4]|uniref:Uncharacterized protein n=1 Tax=Fusarium vanettenii (strain ATCC MYA-4622 / CBS 123669 / FGSC 9596 / NRRL 45880 / 77-13-4) TaxID=660122 RepID=C7ZGG9_FUSV7|nr:uncharacterized protein NECHADRAFT_81085 [Fusarium vanettenii 77-13-4]EEU36934.1 predicted protein [Fusarium vanettenii 77-13-4]
MYTLNQAALCQACAQSHHISGKAGPLAEPSRAGTASNNNTQSTYDEDDEPVKRERVYGRDITEKPITPSPSRIPSLPDSTSTLNPSRTFSNIITMERPAQQTTTAPTADTTSEMPTHTVPQMHGILPSDSTGSRERDAGDKKNKVEEARADEAKMDEAKADETKAAEDARMKGCLADSWERVERALAQGDENFFRKYPQLEGLPTEGS